MRLEYELTHGSVSALAMKGVRLMGGAKYNLLIVDDDFRQIVLFEELLRELKLPHNCHHVINADFAADFLYKRPPYERAERPDLVLLDLDLPGKHGCDLLREIKLDLKLRSIPVIILSASQKIEDVSTCYREHANAFVRKANDLPGALRLVSAIDQFWLRTAELVRERQ